MPSGSTLSPLPPPSLAHSTSDSLTKQERAIWSKLKKHLCVGLGVSESCASLLHWDEGMAAGRRVGEAKKTQVASWAAPGGEGSQQLGPSVSLSWLGGTETVRLASQELEKEN
jgi:hypothetical protein